MPSYYQPEIETASREQILAWQNERLVKQVKHVWDNVPYYRKKMEEKGVTPDDVKSVDDLHKLPFLTKADLRDAYPYGLMGKPLSECVRIQSTSGTTGRRVVAFYTQHDIDLWEDCCARHRRRRRNKGGRRSGCLRLRPVHRRPRPQRRLSPRRLPHAAHVLRQYRAPASVHDRS